MHGLPLDILRIIARCVHQNDVSQPSTDLAAFALVSRAWTTASDPYRLRRIHVSGLDDLNACVNVLECGWRDVGRGLQDFSIHLAESVNGKDRDAGCGIECWEHNASSTNSIRRALQQARRLTKLHVSVSAEQRVAFEHILPSIPSNSLLHLVLAAADPIPQAALAAFLVRQSHLYHLEIPGQHLPYPIEPPSPPVRSCEKPRVNGRKRPRLAYLAIGLESFQRPAVASSPPRSSLPPDVVKLSSLRSIVAPASFLLRLSPSTPLQFVDVADPDIPRTIQKRLFEHLAKHVSESGRPLLHLKVSLSEDSMGLGVMQEITRNLKNLERLVIRSVIRDAYYTYFLQDLTGCISRCQRLRELTFLFPHDYPPVPPFLSYTYRTTPNPDPSVPLPDVVYRDLSPFHPPLREPHLYPPSGPDVYRREQYLVNLYGRTNAALRTVTMPSGTIWQWCLNDREPECHGFADPPLLVPPRFCVGSSPKAVPSTPVVPSSPPRRRRITSRTLPSTAWGWEPHPSCEDARAWWAQCGLKPFHSESPSGSADETEVGDEDTIDEDTDVEHEDDREEDQVILLPPIRCVSSSKPQTPTPAPSKFIRLPTPPLMIRGQKRKATYDLYDDDHC